MKNVVVIFFLFSSFMIFGQEKNINEENVYQTKTYNVVKFVTKIDKAVSVNGNTVEAIDLHGTLITPKIEFDKILIIISGTGDISQEAHKFLTEYLLKNNIGVFRFDKRGVGKSTGINREDFILNINDFIQIYTELQKSDIALNKKIGFLGHSLGGIAAIQAIGKNIKPDFLIQWAVPIGKPRDVIQYQIRNGITNYDNLIIGKTLKDRINSLDYIHNLIDENLNKTAWEIWKIARKDSKIHGITKQSFRNYIMPSTVEFAKLNDIKIYKEIDFPLLVIIGEEDILVDPITNRKTLEELANNNIEFKSFRRLNHFLEENNSLLTVDWNIDKEAKEFIVNWILKN